MVADHNENVDELLEEHKKKMDREFQDLVPSSAVCPCGSGSRGWMVTHPGHVPVQVCIVCYKTRAPG